MRGQGRRRSSAARVKGTASVRSQLPPLPLDQCTVELDAAIPPAPLLRWLCACLLLVPLDCSVVKRPALLRGCCWRVKPPPLQLLKPMPELHWTPHLNKKRHLLRWLDARSWSM